MLDDKSSLPIVFQTLSPNCKSVMLDDNYFYTSNSKTYYDPIEFNLNSKESDSSFVMVRKIPLNRIFKLSHIEVKNNLILSVFYYTGKEKEVKLNLEFDELGDKKKFIDQLAMLISFIKEEKAYPKWKSVFPFIVGAVTTIVLTRLCFSYALMDSTGQEFNFEGDKRVKFIILLSVLLGRKITPWGILIIGVVIFLSIVFFLVKRLKKPSIEVVYSRR